jgi:hypothetical protein
MRSGAESERAQVPFFFDSESAKEGILVQVQGPVQASGEKAGQVTVIVSNLLQEEVFIEVTGLEQFGYEFRQPAANGRPGGCAFGGGGGPMWPDNLRLLKRLHASTYTNGELSTCGCAMAWLKGTVGAADLDLKDWIGADTKIRVQIGGYLRRNGKAFGKELELPIRIVAGEARPR